jgi:hypothetical protein
MVKPWWQSRTLIGVAVMLLSQILRRWHVDIVDAEISDILTMVLDAVGASLAIYGRINARKALKLTVPGGPFNRKATGSTATRANRGSATLDVLLLGAMFFLLLGMALYALPAARVPQIPVPELIGGRPVAEWVQIVRLEDNRPFLARLLSSIRATPSAALVTTEDGTTRILKIEIGFQGGATF